MNYFFVYFRWLWYHQKHADRPGFIIYVLVLLQSTVNKIVVCDHSSLLFVWFSKNTCSIVKTLDLWILGYVFEPCLGKMTLSLRHCIGHLSSTDFFGSSQVACGECGCTGTESRNNVNVAVWWHVKLKHLWKLKSIMINYQ